VLHTCPPDELGSAYRLMLELAYRIPRRIPVDRGPHSRAAEFRSAGARSASASLTGWVNPSFRLAGHAGS
jgi:hypothetical protein